MGYRSEIIGRLKDQEVDETTLQLVRAALLGPEAENAARAALCGQATAQPKSGDGPVEAIRMLGVVRRSAIKAPHPDHQPTTRPGSNRSRTGQTPTREANPQSPRQNLCRFS